MTLDLILAVLCVIVAPVESGTFYTAIISDRGPIDLGIVVVSDGAFTYYDGEVEDLSRVMALTPVERHSTEVYAFTTKLEEPRNIVLRDVVTNKDDFDPLRFDQFTFKIGDGREVDFFRAGNVRYLYMKDTAFTIVIHE